MSTWSTWPGSPGPQTDTAEQKTPPKMGTLKSNNITPERKGFPQDGQRLHVTFQSGLSTPIQTPTRGQQTGGQYDGNPFIESNSSNQGNKTIRTIQTTPTDLIIPIKLKTQLPLTPLSLRKLPATSCTNARTPHSVDELAKMINRRSSGTTLPKTPMRTMKASRNDYALLTPTKLQTSTTYLASTAVVKTEDDQKPEADLFGKHIKEEAFDDDEFGKILRQNTPMKVVPDHEKLDNFVSQALSISKKEAPSEFDGLFDGQQKLKLYQALDLKTLIMREQGGLIHEPHIRNQVGSILAYKMGYGKTVTTIALILAHPPSDEYTQTGCPANLVAVPNKGVMEHWRSELKKFSSALTFHEFTSKKKLYSDLKSTDVVEITYTQLNIQYDQYIRNSGAESIFSVLWYRFITDEAHQFRNDIKTSESVMHISKKHGLCLTGTPAQNSPLDFCNLFRFLEVDYEGITNPTIFQSKIFKRRQKGPIATSEGLRLYNNLKGNFCIFRDPMDSETGRLIVDIPAREDKTIEIKMAYLEREVYETIKSIRMSPFAKLTRLRQACDHPNLLDKVLTPVELQEEKFDSKDQATLFSEINKAAEVALKTALDPYAMLLSPNYMNSKLEVMLEILRTRRNGEKTIIFTHFTSMILPIANVLDKEGIGWIEYTGVVSIAYRAEALRKITNDDLCKVIIVSVKAGGVGLNITACNNVILLEPWWNPFVEEQAIARAHRIGQTRPVNIFRLLAKDAIESMEMAQVQKFKREILSDIYAVPGV